MRDGYRVGAALPPTGVRPAAPRRPGGASAPPGPPGPALHQSRLILVVANARHVKGSGRREMGHGLTYSRRGSGRHAARPRLADARRLAAKVPGLMTVPADLEPATRATGPVIDPDAIRFTFPDADRALSGVRLVQDVRIPATRLSFAWAAGAWSLAIDRPPVDRIEYLFELTYSRRRPGVGDRPRQPRHRAGRLRRQVRARAARLPAPRMAGRPRAVRPATARSRSRPAASGRAVHGRLWSPPGSTTDQPLPLLVVHDGPEYDELAGLTTYLAALVARAAAPAAAGRAARARPSQRAVLGRRRLHPGAVPGGPPPRCRRDVATTRTIGMGASLGALAMLHAHRPTPGSVRRAVPAVRQLLPPAPRRARASVRPLRPGRAQRRQRAARAAATAARCPS